MNTEAKEYSEKIRIENIIKKYSDHITHSVYILESDAKDKNEEKVNKGTALWNKDKKILKKKSMKSFILILVQTMTSHGK